MARFAWTDERIARAVRLRAEGMRVDEVADALGVSIHSVRHKLSRLRNGPRPLKVPVEPLKRSQIAEYWQAGMSGGQIASRLGMTRSAVLGAIRRMQLQRKNDQPAAEMPIAPAPVAPIARRIPKTTRYGVSLALVPTMESV